MQGDSSRQIGNEDCPTVVPPSRDNRRKRGKLSKSLQDQISLRLLQLNRKQPEAKPLELEEAFREKYPEIHTEWRLTTPRQDSRLKEIRRLMAKPTTGEKIQGQGPTQKDDPPSTFKRDHAQKIASILYQLVLDAERAQSLTKGERQVGAEESKSEVGASRHDNSLAREHLQSYPGLLQAHQNAKDAEAEYDRILASFPSWMRKEYLLNPGFTAILKDLDELPVSPRNRREPMAPMHEALLIAARRFQESVTKLIVTTRGVVAQIRNGVPLEGVCQECMRDTDSAQVPVPRPVRPKGLAGL